jgi:type II secretory pathway pseudopilin PulG
MTKEVFPGTCKDDRRGERLADEFGAWHKRRYNAFTLIELVLVVGISTGLAGLVLSTVGYARKKGALARAETEIAAMSAAIENYKADKGVYPYNDVTNGLDARTRGDPADTADPTYSNASVYLYTQLSGDTARNRSPTEKSYMVFKPNMLLPAGGIGTVTAIADPFGYSYGYSTAANPQANPTPSGTPGYNPTFDVWSTTAGRTIGDAPKWIKNW